MFSRSRIHLAPNGGNFALGSGPKATVVDVSARADVGSRGDSAFLLITPSRLEADHHVVPVPRRGEVEDVLDEPELLVGVVPRAKELEELGGRGVLHDFVSLILTVPLYHVRRRLCTESQSFATTRTTGVARFCEAYSMLSSSRRTPWLTKVTVLPVLGLRTAITRGHTPGPNPRVEASAVPT